MFSPIFSLHAVARMVNSSRVRPNLNSGWSHYHQVYDDIASSNHCDSFPTALPSHRPAAS